MDSEFENNELQQTHSVIIDYLTILRESKWVVSAAIGSGILIVLTTILLVQYIVHTPQQDPKFGLVLVTGFGLLAGTGLWLPVTCGTLLWKLLYKRKEREKNLVNAQHYLIRRSYLLNFELVPSEGKDRLEKLFNHLSLVFPEIWEIKEKWDKKRISVSDWNKKRHNTKKMLFLGNYDFVKRTKTGLFVVKFFDKIATLQDLEDNIHGLNIQKLLGLDISRVIFVSKEYDNTLENGDLTMKLQQIKRKFKLDIILESEYGYSTIWIDK